MRTKGLIVAGSALTAAAIAAYAAKDPVVHAIDGLPPEALIGAGAGAAALAVGGSILLVREGIRQSMIGRTSPGVLAFGGGTYMENLTNKAGFRKAGLSDLRTDIALTRHLRFLSLETTTEMEGSWQGVSLKKNSLGPLGAAIKFSAEVAIGQSDLGATRDVRQTQWQNELADAVSNELGQRSYPALLYTITNGISSLSTALECPVEQVVPVRNVIYLVNYGGLHRDESNTDGQLAEGMEQFASRLWANCEGGSGPFIIIRDNSKGLANADHNRFVKLLAGGMTSAGRVANRRESVSLEFQGDESRYSRHPGGYTYTRPTRLMTPQDVTNLQQKVRSGKLDVFWKEFGEVPVWERPGPVFLLIAGNPHLTSLAISSIRNSLRESQKAEGERLIDLAYLVPGARGCWVSLLVPLFRHEVAVSDFTTPLSPFAEPAPEAMSAMR